MFVSTDFLVINYGIDLQIAKFFVDRDPPPDNLYWHEKLLYLRPSPGYLFIPLIVDLLYRLGIDKSQLLSELFIDTMEKIGHISALEEINKITKEEAIEQSFLLIETKPTNQKWVHFIKQYFQKKPESELLKKASNFQALHRGDLFLFSIATLFFNDDLRINIGELWFALITTLLLLDDGDDIQSDIKSGEENAIIESGMNKEGWNNLYNLVKRNVTTIELYNKSMANELLKSYEKLAALPYISTIINLQ